MSRRPGRRVRPDLLEDIIRRWQAGPHQYRLRFEVEWKGKNLSAIEIAASGSGTLSGAPEWADEASELNLMINAAALLVDRTGADIANIGSFCLSLHAVGRYFQRQPERCGADLLQDLFAFSRIAIPPDAPEQDVRYATEHGTWLGRIAHCDVASRDQIQRRAVSFIRTWIAV
jgi:hypothetical protein